MRVYEFSPLGRPKQNRFKEYSILAADDETWSDIAPDGEAFNGVPFPRKWKAPTFYIEKPLVPRPNFWSVCRAVACDEKAREIAGEAMEMAGEFLPIRVTGETGRYWIYNITNTINVLDENKSRWEEMWPGAEERTIVKPAFFPSRFGEETIFKIPNDRGARMYCVEFTGDPEDGEFKAVVEHHELTGLEFTLLWTDEGRP